MRSRSWCLTINNPSEDDCRLLKTMTDIQLLVACLETGSQGTLHYQGYIEFEHQRSLSSLKKKLPRAHLEPRRGTREQALLYCTKDQPQGLIDSMSQQEGWQWSLPDPVTGLSAYIVFQSVPSILTKKEQKQTRAEILQEMKEMIQNGRSDLELAEHNFSVYISCYRGLAHYRMVQSKPRDHPVEVTVIQGPTGTGKSKYCKDTYPDAYWKQRSNWWDGYSDHKTVSCFDLQLVKPLFSPDQLS